ncbi:SDR family oxidoreductase [Pedobacter sp. P351]|uniref:SDR family oxidoreductase n=1 Tax=Pedobacter superstes TaxID=3133441 RepID=UPI0030995C19
MNAVITGATKGMGKAIAIKLAEAGYNLALCSRNQSEIDSFCQELMSQHPSIRAVGISTNCADPLQVTAFANFVLQQFQQVDVLINNVGIFHPGSVLDEEESNLTTQLQVNLHTAYTLCRVFGRKMRDNKSGYIINICSIAAIHPVAAAGSYTVTKLALLGLTKVLRLELMKHKVKVTAILPGSTLTSSWDGTDLPKELFIASEDVANAVLYCLNTSAGSNPEEIIIRPLTGQV